MGPHDADLIRFIEAAKNNGAQDQFLVNLLGELGWPSRDIYRAFRAHYETLTGTPVPGRVSSAEAARDAFLYLLSFVTLGTWTIQLGSLVFNLINKQFPDPVYPGWRGADNGIAWQMAAILVAFPLYLFVMRVILKGIAGSREKLESGVRKWLTYIALLIAASILMGDVITFLGYFLKGEITVRFVLKVITVLIIAGGVFSYYLSSLRRADDVQG